MFKTTLTQLCKRRLYSTHSNFDALDKWITSPRSLVFADSFHFEHLSDLYITLPTRDGIRKPYQPPMESSPLGYGHHLVSFHSRVPESKLLEDGTDDDFTPPGPFKRRMWAGGKISWDPENPLIIGGKASAAWKVAAVDKKGFDTERPVLFVNQSIDITMAGKEQPSVREERAHVYLTDLANGKAMPRQVRDTPASADFSFSYTPSLTTLFRFSALMFNAHHIHLDQEFSQKKEGYPERLVHGPLTAMMLLETAVFFHPEIQIKSFEYRARNPVIVNRLSTIKGVWIDKATIKLWCIDEDGVVGMTGTVNLV